jgi:hypothetical protein
MRFIAAWIFVLAHLLTAASEDPQELARLLANGEPQTVVQAAEAIQKAPPKLKEDLEAVAEAVKSALSLTRDPKAEAALRLALGSLAVAGAKDAAEWALETVEWGFESMSVTHRSNTPVEVFEAHVQALEMVPGAAKELMIGNLEVAINFPEVEPKERQRLKEFVALTAEKMRTRELAVFLDALLSGEDDLLGKMEAPLEGRLLACYKNVKDPRPVTADAVVDWIEKHPGGPVEVELVAIDVVYSVGTTKGEAASQLVERLLRDREGAVAMARRIVEGRLSRKLLPAVKRALEEQQRRMPSADVQRAIEQLGAAERAAK